MASVSEQEIEWVKKVVSHKPSRKESLLVWASVGLMGLGACTLNLYAKYNDSYYDAGKRADVYVKSDPGLFSETKFYVRVGSLSAVEKDTLGSTTTYFDTDNDWKTIDVIEQQRGYLKKGDLETITRGDPGTGELFRKADEYYIQQRQRFSSTLMQGEFGSPRQPGQGN